MTKKLTFIAFLVFSVNLMFSQKTITGNVSDENGPLPGANIIELGTNNGVSTDFDGNFEITVEGNSSIIEVSYTGFKSQTFEYDIVTSVY